jgi:5'-3' exonuclease
MSQGRGVTTLLVDGTNIFRRAASVSDGSPDTALHIFTKMLARYVREVGPSRVMVCWDLGKSEYRTNITADYKANRKPSGHGETWEYAVRFLAAAKIDQAYRLGVEADDLIANLSQRSWLAPCVILSADKDLLQLIGPTVTQIRPDPRSDDEVWDEDRVVEKFGCQPRHLASVMALMGDSGDNIHGVPRVGVKTAVKDLGAHRWDLDRLVNHSPRYHEHRSLIYMNLLLVDLVGHPVPGLESIADPGDFAPTESGDPEWSRLSEICREHGLSEIRSLIEQDALWR